MMWNNSNLVLVVRSNLNLLKTLWSKETSTLCVIAHNMEQLINSKEI